MYNKVIMIGRLTAQPELVTTVLLQSFKSTIK